MLFVPNKGKTDFIVIIQFFTFTEIKWSAVSQFTLHWQVWIKVKFGPWEQIKEVPHWLFIVPVLSSLVLVHRLSCGMMGSVSASAALVHQQYGVSRGAPVSLPLLPLSLTEAAAAEMPVCWCSPAHSEKAFPSSAAAGGPSPSPGHPSVPAGTAPLFHPYSERERTETEREMCLSYPRPQKLLSPLRCVFQSRAARPHQLDTACPPPSGTR